MIYEYNTFAPNVVVFFGGLFSSAKRNFEWLQPHVPHNVHLMVPESTYWGTWRLKPSLDNPDVQLVSRINKHVVNVAGHSAGGCHALMCGILLDLPRVTSICGYLRNNVKLKDTDTLFVLIEHENDWFVNKQVERSFGHLAYYAPTTYHCVNHAGHSLDQRDIPHIFKGN